MPICVLSCQMRALDFGPIDTLTQKYGSNAQLGGMPDPTTTNPSVVFKPKDARKQVVTLDTKVITLMGNRGNNLPPVYSDATTVTNMTPGLVGRNQLNMKAGSTSELMTATSNNDG